MTEDMKEDRASWGAIRQGHDRTRLKGVRLVVGDRCAGLVATVGSMLPKAKYQRCMARFMCNVLSKTPPKPPRMGVRRPEGDIRHGKPGIRAGQGRDGRQGDGRREAEGRGELPAGGNPGDDDLSAARASRTGTAGASARTT